MKANKVLLNITSVFCFLFGACYIFSLVFIPVGIYCFVAGRLFSHKADHLLDNYVSDKKTMKAYTIFASIACFPFGCLSIIAYFGIYGNNVKVEKSEVINFNIFDAPETEETENSNQEPVEEVEEKVEDAKEETEEEKMEKLEKLRKFKEKNIITEEEFEMAKEQIFGKDKK
jgi:hypothetical protein